MNEQIKQIIADFTKYKGKDYQILCAVEEMAELTKALMKNINRQKDNVEDIFEELADVVITLEEIKIIYGISDARIWEYLNEKMPRKWHPRIEKWKARVVETGNPNANKRVLD